MKKLIITVLVFVPILTNAQTFWSTVIDDSYKNISHVTDKGLLQDSIVLVSGFISDASCHGHNLFAYNQTGLRKWNIGGYHDLICTDSEYIYTAGYTPIDDIIGIEQIVVSKYDKNGTEIFSIGYPDSPQDLYFEFEPKNIDLIPGGTILVSSKNSIIKSNIEGTEIKEYNITLESPINSIQSINMVSYLINTQNKIYKTDSSLVLVDSAEFENTINKLLVLNDTLFSLFDSNIVRMDTSLNIIDTIITSSVVLCNMEHYKNNLWVQMSSSDSIRILKLQNFEISDTLTYPILMNNTEFIVSKNNFTFVGNSFTNQIGICNFQIENSEIETVSLPNIELLDFDIDSIVLDYVQMQKDSFARGYSFNTEITIKNNGEETINTFAVYSDLHGGMNCAQNYFYQKFTDLEILPGQTQTLYLKRAYEDGINNNQLCLHCYQAMFISKNVSYCPIYGG
ncbi:MAG: hypothetical protein MI922_06290, partial [Bacteroidales bacterium]|nr:hypothetical protein [Bacteroidales bacterium]